MRHGISQADVERQIGGDMDRKDAKTTSRTLLTLFLAMILLLIVAFSLTACSIFTGFIKGQLGLDSSGKEGGDSSDGSGSLVVDPADGSGEDEDPGITHNDPIVDLEESDIVTINADSLIYDKASRDNMTINATHEGKDYYQILGMGLINEGEQKRVDVLSHARGYSRVMLDGEYLSTLSAGNYYIYYCVADTSGNIYNEPFRIQITDSEAVPTDVKIDYDVDFPNTYVTFHCDCGGKHTVSFDGFSKETAEGATRALVTGVAIDKGISHTAVVTCVSTSRSSQVTKAAPPSDAISGGYLNNYYRYLGHIADRYVEDDKEAADLFEYLAYQGDDTDMQVFVSAEIREKLNDISAYLTMIRTMIDVPWSLSYGCSTTGSSRVVTFSVQNANSGAVISTGYEEAIPYAYDPAISHYEAADPVDKTRQLAIDSKKAVTVRNVAELLAVVEAGYCPDPVDEALSIYNKARDFCYTYLNGDMTDAEKLHVIYDYLAGEIDYDYCALNLFQLIAKISEMSFDDAKDALDDVIYNAEHTTVDDPQYHSKVLSASMIARITEAKNAATDTSDLVAKLKNYLQRLAAFSVEGVFNDGTAVCEGISYAFMLLARIEGIECYQITGYATQSGWVEHAWNKVRLDGVWYCIDATWGNIFMNGRKYVTHRYFMVDDGVFNNDHIETVGEIGAAVENLAIGNLEYYKSVETATGRSLYVKNDADVNAAVAYFYALGSHYVEVMMDDAYHPTAETFGNAYKKAASSSRYSIVYSNEGKMFIAYLE